MPPSVTNEQTLRIEYIELGELKKYPGNPKAHATEVLDESLDKFGYVDPILIDERTGLMVAGHGRLDRLESRKAAGQKPPGRIQVRDGKWFVPVVRGVRFKDRKQAEQFLIASNQTTILGGWDNAELVKMLSGYSEDDLSGIGFDSHDLVQFMALADSMSGKTDPDDVPDPPKKPITKSGDLWTLGKQKILCGDSTKPKDVARVMSDAGLAIVMNTDPPYGVDYATVKNGIPGSGFRDIKERVGDIENDTITDGAQLQVFLESAIRTALPHLHKTCAFYLWHPMLTQGTFFAAAAAAAADILIHRQIIWVKPHLVLTRSGMYHWRHELCFYGWVRGNKPPWYGPKNQTSVMEVGYSDGSETGTEERNHPTQKPVALFEFPLRNHSKKGELCYEPFSGSGSQLIAAERLERRCCAIEIDPRYVDVAVERWQNFTGQKAARSHS